MKSIQTKHVFRGAVDLYFYYMFWALVILGISVVARTALWIFVDGMQTQEETPLTLFRGPGQIFMLILGIVAGVYVIAYFIRQGVTRRSLLLSGVLAGLATAVSLQILGFLLYGLTLILDPLLPITLYMSGIPQIGATGLALGVAVDILLTTAFYLMGWIIGFTFCRFRLPGGMLSIFAGIAVLGSLTSIWGEDVEIYVTGIRIPPIDGLSTSVSIVVTVGLLAAQLASLYLLVRNAPLKVR